MMPSSHQAITTTHQSHIILILHSQLSDRQPHTPAAPTLDTTWNICTGRIDSKPAPVESTQNGVRGPATSKQLHLKHSCSPPASATNLGPGPRCRHRCSDNLNPNGELAWKHDQVPPTALTPPATPAAEPPHFPLGRPQPYVEDMAPTLPSPAGTGVRIDALAGRSTGHDLDPSPCRPAPLRLPASRPWSST